MLSEELYKKTIMQEYMEELEKKVQQEEERMRKELEEKRQFFIQQAYEEGKVQAGKEAEEMVRNEQKLYIEQAQNIHEQANEHLKSIIEKTESMRNHYLEEKKEELVDFVTYLMKKMFHLEIDVHPEKVQTLYEEAMNHIQHESKKVYVRVHPETERLLVKNDQTNVDKRIEFLRDNRLEIGDFVIEVDTEFIDKTVRYQLDRLKEYIRGVLND